MKSYNSGELPEYDYHHGGPAFFFCVKGVNNDFTVHSLCHSNWVSRGGCDVSWSCLCVLVQDPVLLVLFN